MLFFYRLLFAKYPNYSKPNFTLFVLQQNDHKFKILNEMSSLVKPQVEEETMFVDFQFSLKHDPNVSVESSAMTLVHNVYDPAIFTNLVGLFDGFIEEIVKNKVYSIFDPDQNRIFIVNKSVVGNCSSSGDDSSSSSSSIALEETVAPGCAHIFNTAGLGDKYNSHCRRNRTAPLPQPTVSSHLAGLYAAAASAAANLNSPSETASYDSSKDSANWSFSSGSNHNTTTAACHNNNNDAFNYKELHSLRQQKPQRGLNSENSGSVKNLIKKFNSQHAPLTGASCYPTSNKSFMSCNNLKKMLMLKKKKLSSEEDEEYEEDEGVDHDYSDDSNGSESRTFANFNKSERELRTLFRGRPSLNSSLSDLSSINKGKPLPPPQPPAHMISNRSRCLSAAATAPVNHELTSPASNVMTRRPRNNSGSINATTLLKKSKSVTFLDSIDQIDRVNSVINQRIENYDLVNRNLIQRERSKSTLPFVYSNVRYEYLDDEGEEEAVPAPSSVNYNHAGSRGTVPCSQQPRMNSLYLNCRNPPLVDRSNYSNCLIDPKCGGSGAVGLDSNRFNLARNVLPRRNIMMNNPSRPKPYVGVTPETRFRRSHTLSMIRNSRMPLNAGNYEHFSQNNYSQQSRRETAPPGHEARGPRSFNILNYSYPIAKF
jgi:hypothetical protein